MTIYLQALDRHAFGNYRNLLQEVTLTPAMGSNTSTCSLSTRTNPNGNLARESSAAFLNRHGCPESGWHGAGGCAGDAAGLVWANAGQRVYACVHRLEFRARRYRARHGKLARPNGSARRHQPRFQLENPVEWSSDSGVRQRQRAVNVACAQADLTLALDNIFNHSNVGPFISKQLIQHLVTSNPSPPYVGRVAAVFNNDCAGLYPISPCSSARGNLKAVVQAILLDPEARGDVKTDPNYGKLREPAQYITGFLRAFSVKSFDKLSTSDGVLGNRSSTDFTGTLDQPIFLPNTVFSYYQPGYEVPGTKILGPAFGILSTSTTLRRANDINTLAYSGVSANTTPTALSPDRPRGTSIDIANLEAIAANPADIADALNPLLFHGTMSTQMRTSIITAMNAINDATVTTRNQNARGQLVYLAATSSQYDIQR